MSRAPVHSIELCAGAGGLALATSQAGFVPVAMLERDPEACKTINENRERGRKWAKTWPVASPADIREFDFSSITTPVDLLSGGPPCQPFSVAGKHLGVDDDRDLFLDVARAMSILQPSAILIENTKGLARGTFERQLKYIRLQLTFPGHRRKPGEHWTDTLRRLEQVAGTKGSGFHYDVSWNVLNAADYGVPQQRERMIFVGFRGGDFSFKFPSPTHSLDALLYQQWVSHEYWERHKIASRRRPKAPDQFERRIEQLKEIGKPSEKLPWVTVRDAIASLPQPTDSEDSKVLNHRLLRGARVYDGHTGSVLDLPAKVLKAGRHGVPGGENMLAHLNGKVRYFTIRECARLQTFPDSYFFCGTWSKATRQLGNAVPVLMCRRVAEAIRRKLESIAKASESTAAASGHSRPPRRRIA